MANNLIYPFATGAGANVPNDAAWAVYAALAQGFQAGVAPSAGVNKALRQSTAVASGLGQFVADYSAQDFSDSLSPGTMETNLRIAIAAAQAGAYFAPDTSSTPNSVVLALNPVPVTLNSFIAIYFKVANTNTSACTLTLNGFPSRSLLRRDGTSLQAGDLVAGRFAHVLYDASLGAFRMVGAVASDTPAPSGGTGDIGPGLTNYRVPTNFRRVTNNTRSALSGQGVNNFVTAMTVPAYSKIGASNATNLMVIAEIGGYVAVQGGAGATFQQLTDGNGHVDQKYLAMDINLSGVGAVAIKDTSVFYLTGVSAGTVNLTLQWARQDTTSWTSIANPDGVDFGGSGSHTGVGATSTFNIMEVPV
ncbi:hypothetical protein [Methylobacterium sp. 1030]|uniref:hypothetical protein n=1 Tax=Methylobacterium sp. 1030 TaxID=3156404 RepID=UPI00339B2DA5